MKSFPPSLLAMLAFALLAGSARAGLKGEIGLLTDATLEGNNPATGEPWKAGDPYRFVFHSNADTGQALATETNITWYDDFLQNLANASTVYPIGEDDGVTWRVIGSTSTVDARDHTSTNPNLETGCAIYLLDGSTLVAKDNAELWSGQIQHIINITERGETWTFWPYTGTKLDGTKRTGGSDFAPLGSAGHVGQGNASSTTQWIWRIWTGSTAVLPFYAMSEPLTVQTTASAGLTIYLR